LDGLFLAMSRLGMNDMVYLFFSLLAVFVYYAYLQKKNLEQLLLLGLIFGLALGTKWTVIWLIAGVFIWELRAVLLKRSWLELPFLVFSLLLVPATTYVLLFTPYFLAGKSLADWWQLQTQIWHFQWHLAESSPYQSQALSWLFQWQSLPLFKRTVGNWSNLILAQVNPVFILFFVLALLWLLFFSKKRWQFFQTLDQEFYLVLAVFLLSFLPWQFVSRPHFIYHFLPALPYLVLLLSRLIYGEALKISRQCGRRAFLFNALFWPALVFICFYPFWTGLRVPTSTLTLYFTTLK
jgi:dolichyl-phosphate-mannose--protein O-mannosyl transferase